MSIRANVIQHGAPGVRWRRVAAVAAAWLVSADRLLATGTGLSAGADSLTLQDCLRLAAERDPRVGVAGQRVVVAQAGARAARAELMPRAQATLFGYRYARQGEGLRTQENPTDQIDPETGRRVVREEETLLPAFGRSDFGTDVSLTYPLYDGGRRRNRYDAARTAVAAAAGDLDWTRAGVRADVKEGFYLLLEAQEMAAIQQEALSLSERRLQVAMDRLAMKVGAEVDVLRGRLAVADARARRLRAQHEVARTSDRLRELIGVSGDEALALVPPKSPPRSVPAFDPQERVTRAVDSSPALARLRAAVEAARLALEATRATRYPEVAGQAAYARGGEEARRVYADLDRNWRLNVNLVLTYDLFDGGRAAAATAEAWARVEEARLALEEERLRVARQVRGEFREMERLAELLEVADAAAQMASRDMELMEERYRLGEGSLLEALDGELAMIEARTRLTQARYAIEISRAHLERWTGSQAEPDPKGGTDPP